MSTNILGSTPNWQWQETWSEDTLRSGMDRGYLARRSQQSEAVFSGSYRFRFGASNCSLSSFKTFFDARRGSYDSFLWKARTYAYSHVDGEAVGTGTGAVKVYPLDLKHIDASTLVVYIDSAVQSSGYTLTSNYDAPEITLTTVLTSTSSLTADYQYYIPVVMADKLTVVPLSNDLASTQTVETPDMVFKQDSPGSHTP